MKKNTNRILIEKRYGINEVEKIDFFREISFSIDKDPNQILQYLCHPVIESLVKDRESTCLQRTKLLEIFAYGDASVLLASPGPSLAGLVIRELGTFEQQEMFFNYVANNKARTFLAVTEPQYGSDANQMQTRLEKDKEDKNLFYLNGEKWLVGNGACGAIGVVIARSSVGPLGITAVLLSPKKLLAVSDNGKSYISRKTLPTTGLVGAQLAHLVFNACPIENEYILGRHLSAVNRGMLAVIKTFNRMRPCVGALAIGLAQAIIDYILTNRENFRNSDMDSLDQLQLEIDLSRQLLHKSAIKVDSDPLKGAFVSLAKMQATRTVERVAEKSLDFFGKGVFFEHPLLAKWYRDCFGFEYMEGTTFIHKRNIFQGYSNGNL